MAACVLITIDTELTWGHYVPGGDWRTHVERSFDAGGVGIPYQIERLRAHGLKACFFVDPMPALIYGLDPIRAMVEPILAAGQEVQLHLILCGRIWARGVPSSSPPTMRCASGS